MRAPLGVVYPRKMRPKLWTFFSTFGLAFIRAPNCGLGKTGRGRSEIRSALPLQISIRHPIGSIRHHEVFQRRFFWSSSPACRRCWCTQRPRDIPTLPGTDDSRQQRQVAAMNDIFPAIRPLFASLAYRLAAPSSLDHNPFSSAALLKEKMILLLMALLASTTTSSKMGHLLAARTNCRRTSCGRLLCPPTRTMLTANTACSADYSVYWSDQS